jgi:N-acetylglucosaminyl-diphospho-decaprenol L-rhamnosyltransferase
MSVDLSIIIATRNSSQFIEPCLASLWEPHDGVRAEIIVVDNGSSDRTLEIVRSRFPQATVIQNSTNLGHCRAMNAGFAAARGRYLMVLDVDTIVLPGTLRHVCEFLRANEDVAIVAPRMLNLDGTVQETARRFPTVMNALFGRQTMLTRLFPNNRFLLAYLQREQRDEMQAFEVDWVSAACMAFPRTLVERLGPWDEGFGGYWVDADWCARAHSVGRVYCVPAGRVVHAEQNRVAQRKGARRIVQFHTGVYRFYRKHYTRGAADPRAVAAALALAARATLLFAVDCIRPVPAPPLPAPMTIRKTVR